MMILLGNYEEVVYIDEKEYQLNCFINQNVFCIISV